MTTRQDGDVNPWTSLLSPFFSFHKRMDPLTIILVALTAMICLVLWWGKSGPGTKTITFYTLPSCGACRRLQPELDRLKAAGPPDVVVEQVNCSEDRCSAISKYPTVVCQGKEYSGERTAEAMKAWAVSC